MDKTTARRVVRWVRGFAGVFAVLVLAAASADAATLSLGEVSGLPGQTQLSLPLSLAVSSGEQVNAVAVDVRFDPAVTLLGSFALEPSVLALNKQVQTSQVAPGHWRLVVYGLDRQTLSSGTVGRCLIGIAPATSATSSVVSLQDGLGVNADGQESTLGLADGRVWIDAVSDTTAPAIGNIALSAIVDGKADVGWSTNEPSACRLEYGTTASYGKTVSSAAGFITTHSVAVADILPSTMYHYQVFCEDTAGNAAATGDRTFATPAGEPAPQPSPELDPEPAAAAVVIVSPADGSTISGSSVYLQFSVSGAVIRSGTGYQHLHIKLDSGKVWHVYNTKPFPLGSLKPGSHTVSVMLAENDTHSRVSGTSTATITFTVQ